MLPQDIAVIIPLHNGAPWIADTLQSVLAQTRAPAEVVVVDDHSTDDGGALAGTFPSVRVLKHPGRGGGHARDFGLASTRSPWVTFLDQDDVWAPTHLANLADILATQAKAVAATAECQPFSGVTPYFGSQAASVAPTPLPVWHHFPFGVIECPSLVLMKRSVLEKTGTWADQTPTMADLELWLHMALHGEIWTSAQVTTGRRVHAASYSGALRRRPLKYLDSLATCARKLLALSQQTGTESALVGTSRMTLLRSLRDAAEALESGNSRAFEKAAASYVKELNHEPDSFKATALANFAWFLEPITHTHGSAREIWWSMADQTAVTTTSLQPWLKSSLDRWPRSMRLRHLCSAPWSRSRWQHLRQSAPNAGVADRQEERRFGIDSDGWARKHCAIQYGRGMELTPMRLRMEIPYWAPKIASQINIRIHPECEAQCDVRNGIYEVVIPAHPSTESLPVITIDCVHEFPLPDDGRLRSIRILEMTPTDSVETRLLVRRERNTPSPISSRS